MADAGGIVALLFTDLVGSTALYDRLGDTAAEELRQAHFALLRGAAAQGGGNEVKSMGDGLMVVFPSAVAAVAAAVEMQRLVAGDAGAPPMRVGINIGEPIRAEADYFGLSVAIARRLCDAAAPGQILTSGLVRALVRGRIDPPLRPVGALSLKGVVDAVDAFEVVWREAPPAPSADEPADTGAAASQLPLPTALAAASTRPLVGREKELIAVQEAWEVAGSRAELVLLRGEPGIGKTRLAAEAARRSHAAGSTVLFGRCDEEPLGSYQPFLDAAGHVARHTPAPALKARLGVLAGDLIRVVPEVGERLGVAAGGAAEELERHRLFDAFARLLSSAGGPPVVVVVDDLHWADGSTLALLRHLLRANEPILVLGTYRDTDLVRTHPFAACLADWRRDGIGRRIDVGGLVDVEVGRLLFPDEQPGALADVVAAVTRETEGNPFFAIEIGRHLRETGTVVHDDDGFRVEGRFDALTLPEGVREVIGRRLSRLSAETNHLLAAASVVGRTFSLDDLAALGVVDADTALALLEPAIEARVVGELAGELDRFGFGHALLRQTLYEELPTSRRARLHHAFAELVRSRVDPDDDADPRAAEIAHHLLEAVPAADAHDAAVWALRAGWSAVSRAAYEEGRALADRGLRALDEAPTVLRCDLLLLYCDAAIAVGDSVLGIEMALAASEIATLLDDPTRLARAAILTGRALGGPAFAGGAVGELVRAALAHPQLEPADRARLLAMWAWQAETRGELRERAAAAVAAARAAEDVEALGYALLAQADVLADEPGTDLGLSILDEVDTLQLPGRLRRGRLPAAGRRLVVTYARGDRDTLERRLDELAAVGRHTDWPGWRNGHIVNQGMLAVLDGRLNDAEELALRALSADTNPYDPLVLTAGALLMTVRREQDRIAAILDPLEQAAAAQPRVSAYRAALAAMAAEAGDAGRARAALDGTLEALADDMTTQLVGHCLLLEAAALLDEHALVARIIPLVTPFSGQGVATGGVPMAAADHYVGIGLASLGRIDEAAASFERAVDVARRLRSPLWEAHAQVQHARLLGAEGSRLLAAAQATADALGLPRVRRLIGET